METAAAAHGKSAAVLKQQETDLAARAKELEQREAEALERERASSQVAAGLNHRESGLAGREAELAERESILQRRADELDAKALSAGGKEGELDRRSVGPPTSAPASWTARRATWRAVKRALAARGDEALRERAQATAKARDADTEIREAGAK